MGEEVAEPVDAVACRPRFVTVPVEAMDSNDVDDRVDALRYYLQALGNFGVGLLIRSERAEEPSHRVRKGLRFGVEEVERGPAVLCMMDTSRLRRMAAAAC